MSAIASSLVCAALPMDCTSVKAVHGLNTGSGHSSVRVRCYCGKLGFEDTACGFVVVCCSHYVSEYIIVPSRTRRFR